MTKMKPEILIAMLSKRGIKIFICDGVISAQGGGIHKMKNSHPVWQLLKIHLNELESYLGTTS